MTGFQYITKCAPQNPNRTWRYNEVYSGFLCFLALLFYVPQLHDEIALLECKIALNTSSIGPKVVMKMDIEGSEYVVLPDLLVRGAVCGIDHIFGEFHPHFTPLNFTGMNDPLRKQTDASRLIDAMELALSSSRQCETGFQNLDDEAYLIDATPLPGM